MSNTNKLPIEWTIGEQADDAGDGHVTFHYADGESSDGKKWTGKGVKCDGELIHVEDIEEEVDIILNHLAYGSYAANRGYGMTHEQLVKIGIGNDQFKLKYESCKKHS